jgi:hypothetical protein
VDSEESATGIGLQGVERDVRPIHFYRRTSQLTLRTLSREVISAVGNGSKSRCRSTPWPPLLWSYELIVDSLGTPSDSRREVSRTSIDKAVEKIEKGDAWDETGEVVRVEAKRPLDKVIPVRLPSDKWEQIRAEARELGIGPTTLARMWILERLRRQVQA